MKRREILKGVALLPFISAPMVARTNNKDSLSENEELMGERA
jgi:hypothetical protein